MRPIGFSTGSISLANFSDALEKLRNTSASAVELSALREGELEPLVAALPQLELGQYLYLSIHAPSRLSSKSEREVVTLLTPAIQRGFNIIIHPDTIRDYAAWVDVGSQLCVENMDNRKACGRTASELGLVFDRLPSASLCFDIGHAWHIDRTMAVAEEILHTHGHRLKQVHLSEVDFRGIHKPLTIYSINAFHKVSSLIPMSIPIIIESVVQSREQILQELRAALASLDKGLVPI
jgi:hypothetical protein